MGDEDRNPEIIRKESKELNNIRKEQQIMRLWVGVLLGANLLLLAGFLWVSGQGTKQPVPAETGIEYPPPAPPVEEDSSIWIADKIPKDVDNTDNTNETEGTDDTNNADYTEDTDYREEPLSYTESSSPPAPVAVTPITTRPAAARTVKTAVRRARKKTVVVIPACIITRPGMTLRSLARLYYGSEVFWVYIYDPNMRVLSSLETSSFDALPPGIQLGLPRPADYGIDATEPISLQRACNLAKSLAEHEKKQQSIK